MEVFPIRTESDYQAALKEIEALFDAAPNTPEYDRLDILSTLAENYEKVHFPIEPPDPIEAILYYMDARGLSSEDLEQCLGGQARVSEVLSRKCILTLEMIRNLSQKLGIPSDVLIKPYSSVQTPV